MSTWNFFSYMCEQIYYNNINKILLLKELMNVTCIRIRLHISNLDQTVQYNSIIFIAKTLYCTYLII